MELSSVERETLKAIYRLAGIDAMVKAGPLAEALDISPASVTARLRRLDERGLAVHARYHGVSLTQTGRELAISAIRRHRIVERFLADSLGFDWEEADGLAVTFEHDLPVDVVRRMFAMLGSPTTCPHGFPIPDAGADELPRLPRLTDLTVGEVADVAVSRDVDPEAAAFLEDLGVRPGVRVEVIEKHPFDGPVVIAIDGAPRTIGNNLAREIYMLAATGTEVTT
ncbi:MAG TPA: metal-dependent transcriptional regulator [Acidimicrobiia bacterium]